ncbi:MAG: hypothetical protein JSU73_05770 [candidate division WOR-3 bacterium]|nr:MAG: hypothetical protein JSU73_05770 [candidate division WOR-3 bacterium]
MRHLVSFVPLALVLLSASTGCWRNKPPSVPEVTSDTAARAGDTLQALASSTDPEGEEVSYLFDWGDTTSLEWTTAYASGRTVVREHVYTDTGKFSISVKSRDSDLLESDWSTGSAVLIGPQRNSPPTAPDVAGPDAGGLLAQLRFTAVATDPDSHQIAYCLSWGDGDTTAWSLLVPSGVPSAWHHAFLDSGVYEVTAVARDRFHLQSAWSSPKLVAVGVGLPPPSEPANLTYEATGHGNKLKLEWDSVAGALGYRVRYDGRTMVTSDTEYTVDTASKVVEVTAFNEVGESQAVTVDCEAVVTASIEVYGKSDSSPDHPQAFGFATDGKVITYALSESSNWPMVDYIMDDESGPMDFSSPNTYWPPYNNEDNTIADAPTTDFDAATNADGDFYTKLEAVEGMVYYLWIDPSANGWDLEDNFAKAKVMSIAGKKVTLKLAFQTIPGLSWLVTD